MAEPIDSAVMLEDAAEIVQEQYFNKYEEQYHDRFGSTTNKMFMPMYRTMSSIRPLSYRTMDPSRLRK